ncbi:MAG: MBL fold metallo-hydrolase, partial [Deltaproteobacteria bacterium]
MAVRAERGGALVRVTVLGSGDAFGSGGRWHSAYLVESAGATFLLDCGPTILQSLKSGGHDTGRIDFVLVSHLHGDHFGGIPFLFMEYIYEQPRTRPLRVYGPPGTERRVRALFAALYEKNAGMPMPFPVRFEELEPGTSRLPDRGRRPLHPLLRRLRLDGGVHRALAWRGSLHLRVLHLRDPARHPHLVSRDRGARARARLQAAPPLAPRCGAAAAPAGHHPRVCPRRDDRRALRTSSGVRTSAPWRSGVASVEPKIPSTPAPTSAATNGTSCARSGASRTTADTASARRAAAARP